jgi:hypothetical protein
MAFSSQALQAIHGFAANLGLPAQPALDGSYSFVFERSGMLTLTSSTDGERVLLSLFMQPSRLDEDVERRLLDLAGPDITTNRFLSVGLTRDGGALFAVGIDDAEMGLPVLDTCLQQLMAARSAVA